MEKVKLGNTVYLSGQWKNLPDRTVSVKDSKLFLAYKAKKVNVVAGGNSKIRVSIDGKALGTRVGEDTKAEGWPATALISQQRLYNIISSPGYETHVLEINAEPGLELYTFTFG